MGLHEPVAGDAQIVGLILDGAAVDGRSVQKARDLLDLLARSERAANFRRSPTAHVFLTLDVVLFVDRSLSGRRVG